VVSRPFDKSVDVLAVLIEVENVQKAFLNIFLCHDQLLAKELLTIIGIVFSDEAGLPLVSVSFNDIWPHCFERTSTRAQI
jgi:hypothetical protein